MDNKEQGGSRGYVFDSTRFKSERKRLRAIEKLFDPSSRRRLLSAGIASGRRCLEVGAGAGSLARWMSRRVGPSGHVQALDINTRYLDRVPANVTVVESDVRATDFEPNSFDVIHARYVLVHIPEYQKVLTSLWNALRPGGGMVIEEPDFTVYRGFNGAEMPAFNSVHEAISHMYTSKGVNPALGAQLPALFQNLGAKSLFIENDAPMSRGGSGIAKMMNLSAVQLKEKYLATGKVTAADLDAYARFTQDPASWAIYYATVGVIARK